MIHFSAVAPLVALTCRPRRNLSPRCSPGVAYAQASGKPKLTDHQQGEAIKRLEAGESCRSIAKTFGVHNATIRSPGCRSSVHIAFGCQPKNSLCSTRRRCAPNWTRITASLLWLWAAHVIRKM